MKNLLVLLIASSLSLFATIDGKDENVYIKAIHATLNIPKKDSDYRSITDAYCKNRSKPDNDARVRPDAKTEFNRTVKRCSTGH